MIRRFFIRLLGLAAGFVVGQMLVGAVVYAQTVLSYRIDAQNTVCWDQPAASLAEANALKVRVSYDAAAPADVAFECKGSASPFACNLKVSVPLAVQTTAGNPHRVKVEGATVDPLDGVTLSSYATLVDFQANFFATPQPPSAGSNGRIVKLVLAIVAAFVGLWAWLT